VYDTSPKSYPQTEAGQRPAHATNTASSAEVNSGSGLKRGFSRLSWWARECIAAALWLFIALKVLVYDVDVAIAKALPPQADMLLKYKIFVILGSTATLWLLLGNRRFLRGVAYIFFYPLVLILWKIPKLLFKNWVVLLVFSPAIHSMVTGFRMNFILASFSVLAGLIVAASTESVSLIAAMTFLALYYCRHVFRKFRMAFQPASVFANLAEAIRKFWNLYKDKTLPDQVRVESLLDPTSDAYRAKTLENLNSLYLVNSLLLAIAEKLKRAAISRRLDIYFIASLLCTVLLTVAIFAFEYFGLEKIHPGSFLSPIKPGFWEFLSFSFNTMMTAGISPITPKSAIAQVMAHSELAAALLLLVILVFVVLTIIRERFREDVELTITELRNGAELIEGHIQQQYKLTIPDVELKAQRPTVNLLRRLRGLQELEVEMVPEKKPDGTSDSRAAGATTQSPAPKPAS